MIGFAHRGAPAAGMRENTLAAFTQRARARCPRAGVGRLADRRRGARPGARPRRAQRPAAPDRSRPCARADLPGWLPTLDALYEAVGGDFDLSLDVKDPAAALPTIEVAARHGAADRLWLCGSAGHVREWRRHAGGGTPRRLHDAARATAEPMLDERIDEAADAGADALNLRAPEWSPERVQRCHERGMLAFAWDVQQPATLERMRDHGCDAIFSDFLTLLAAA